MVMFILKYLLQFPFPYSSFRGVNNVLRLFLPLSNYANEIPFAFINTEAMTFHLDFSLFWCCQPRLFRLYFESMSCNGEFKFYSHAKNYTIFITLPFATNKDVNPSSICSSRRVSLKRLQT